MIHFFLLIFLIYILIDNEFAWCLLRLKPYVGGYSFKDTYFGKSEGSNIFRVDSVSMHVTYALALYNVDENVDCSGYKRTECPESD